MERLDRRRSCGPVPAVVDLHRDTDPVLRASTQFSASAPSLITGRARLITRYRRAPGRRRGTARASHRAVAQRWLVRTPPPPSAHTGSRPPQREPVHGDAAAVDADHRLLPRSRRTNGTSADGADATAIGTNRAATRRGARDEHPGVVPAAVLVDPAGPARGRRLGIGGRATVFRSAASVTPPRCNSPAPPARAPAPRCGRSTSRDLAIRSPAPRSRRATPPPEPASCTTARTRPARDPRRREQPPDASHTATRRDAPTRPRRSARPPRGERAWPAASTGQPTGAARGPRPGLRLDQVEEDLDDVGVELRARAERDLVDRFLHRHRRPVGAVVRHRVERVGDREHASRERDLFMPSPVGYPVPSHRSWCIALLDRPWRNRIGCTMSAPIADAPASPPLLSFQRSRLAEDLFGDPDLADVVEEEPEARLRRAASSGSTASASCNPSHCVRSRWPAVVRSLASTTWAKEVMVAI